MESEGARVIDPMDEERKFRKRVKEEQMSQYELKSDAMKQAEINRLLRKKRNPGYKIVTEFDCGSKARRRRKDADLFD